MNNLVGHLPRMTEESLKEHSTVGQVKEDQKQNLEESSWATLSRQLRRLGAYE